MKSIRKIAGINLVIIIIYSCLIRVISSRGDNMSMSIVVFSAMAVGFHVIFCLIVTGVAYAGRDSELGRAWLLSAGIVLLVGYSVCLGNAKL